MQILDIERFRAARITSEPYEYLVLPDFVRADCLARIHADFPRIDRGGSFPLASLCYGSTFADLAEELMGDELRDAFAENFAMDLSQRPTTLTVRGCCRQKDGKIHIDSRSKLITVLVYLNDNWEAPGGRLRLLRSNNMSDVIAHVLLRVWRRITNPANANRPFE